MNGAGRHRRPRTVARALLAVALALGATLAVLQGLTHYYDPVRGNAPRSVIILTTEWCGYCAALRDYLRNNGIPYRELDAEKSVRGVMAFWATRARGVPVTVVGQQVVHGFARRDGTSGIDEALEAAGYTLKQRIGRAAS